MQELERKMIIIEDWIKNIQRKINMHYDHIEYQWKLENWQKQLDLLEEYKSFLQKSKNNDNNEELV